MNKGGGWTPGPASFSVFTCCPFYALFHALFHHPGTLFCTEEHYIGSKNTILQPKYTISHPGTIYSTVSLFFEPGKCYIELSAARLHCTRLYFTQTQWHAVLDCNKMWATLKCAILCVTLQCVSLNSLVLKSMNFVGVLRCSLCKLITQWWLSAGTNDLTLRRRMALFALPKVGPLAKCLQKMSNKLVQALIFKRYFWWLLFCWVSCIIFYVLPSPPVG